MPSILPDGDPAPSDGRLPEGTAARSAGRDFSLYVHIPFCAVRCGYCDFNTYTASELGGGASQATYANAVSRELKFAQRALTESGIESRQLSTVFFGGGTPTLLPANDLASVLRTAKDLWGFKDGAEITTEANPDSVTKDSLKILKDAGFTRVSFGMQSAVPHVLKVLDRTHQPENVGLMVQAAKDLGLDVSVDLIYGTPGESLEDWKTSLETAIGYEPDHISAYSLIVEPGTKLAAQMRRGEVPEVDEDDHAEKYELADSMLAAAGFTWYEVSNWAKTEDQRSEHNLAYWRGNDWWGAGPGAHSHIGGTRFWNVKHPTAYQGRVDALVSPAAAREIPDEDAQYLEELMLKVRIAEGLPLSALRDDARRRVAGLIADGLVEPGPALGASGEKRLVLTLNGRLLADRVVKILADF